MHSAGNNVNIDNPIRQDRMCIGIRAPFFSKKWFLGIIWFPLDILKYKRRQNLRMIEPLCFRHGNISSVFPYFWWYIGVSQC